MNRLITHHIWASHNYRCHRSGVCLKNSSDSYPMAHGAMAEGTSNNCEKVSNVQKTKPKHNKWDQKGRTRSYADMAIYAIDPAGMVSTMCPHKPPTTIVTFLILSNLWYLIASLWLNACLVVLCSSLLLCWLSGSGQGPEVCWSGSTLGFCGLPTSYQLILSERNPGSSTFHDSYRKKSVSYLWIALASPLSLID